MCVIAYKAKDVRFPSRDNIREMWDANPDGAGIMWRDPGNGTIRTVKGFMSRKKFMKWVKRNGAWLEEVECALHFRITTHGGTSRGNCHPFSVDPGTDLHALEGVSKRVLMHNGVLPLLPRRADISDTGELALRLSECADPEARLRENESRLRGNRIILMDENGTHFHGDAFRESRDPANAGILYSNLNWENRLDSSWFSLKAWDPVPCFRDEYVWEGDPSVPTERERKRLVDSVIYNYGICRSSAEIAISEAEEFGIDVFEYLDSVYDDFQEYAV